MKNLHALILNMSVNIALAALSSASEKGSIMVGVRQFDESAALAAALETFWSQGLAATTMPDLARATGVQRGSLYNAYGDKETIFLRAFDLYEDRFLKAVEVSLTQDDAGALLRSVFETAIANMTAGSPPRGCLTTKTAVDGSTASALVHDRLRVLVERLSTMLEAACSRPSIAQQLTLSPPEAAAVIVTFTRGLAVMERIVGDSDFLSRTASSLTRSLVDRHS